jgi:hypothetical protein
MVPLDRLELFHQTLPSLKLGTDLKILPTPGNHPRKVSFISPRVHSTEILSLVALRGLLLGVLRQCSTDVPPLQSIVPPEMPKTIANTRFTLWSWLSRRLSLVQVTR